VAEEDVIRGVVAAALATLAGASAAHECAAALNHAAPLIAEAGGARVAFVPRPMPVPVGRHFDIHFVVCGFAPRSDATIAVDADMPAHRHGMNYRARVDMLPTGVYRASGLMFHMPGTWRVIFDLPIEGRTLRVTRDIEVQ
jgi:hypothetical protein